MEKIAYKIYENTCNDVNTLKLEAIHPLRSQLIACREHNRKTGNVTCTLGRSTTFLDPSKFSKLVADEVSRFEVEIRELEDKNISSDLVGREIFSAFETK